MHSVGVSPTENNLTDVQENMHRFGVPVFLQARYRSDHGNIQHTVWEELFVWIGA